MSFSNVVTIAAGSAHALIATGDQSALITVNPHDTAVLQNSQTLLTVTAAGAAPIHYQWQFNGADLPDGTNSWLKLTNLQPFSAGAYRVIVSNCYNSATSTVANLEVRLPLASALNSSKLLWTTGVVPWFGQDQITHDGIAAARTSSTRPGCESYLSAGLTGPGTLQSRWKVSSDPAHAALSVLLDGVPQASIAGAIDWENQVVQVPAGFHVLKWSYTKDSSADQTTTDAAWLDEVTWIPDPPVISVQPPDITVSMGDLIVLSVAVSGAPPFDYQWLKNGSILDGQREPTLVSWNATRRDSGLYSVNVSGSGGTTTSSNAVVKVLVPQNILQTAWGTNGAFTLFASDADGGVLDPSDLPAFDAQVSTNLLDWLPLDATLRITNGTLLITDPAASNSPAKYYRVRERAVITNSVSPLPMARSAVP